MNPTIILRVVSLRCCRRGDNSDGSVAAAASADPPKAESAARVLGGSQRSCMSELDATRVTSQASVT